MKSRLVMDEKGIERATARIAHEILERNRGTEGLVILGIPTRGYGIALRLQSIIEVIEGVRLPAGAVDATLYRDDLGIKKEQPFLKKMEIPIAIDGKTIVLVDDVLFTGRTIRAALDALIDYGRPMRVQVAVLVDRDHRELPICSQFVGISLETSPEEQVNVLLAEKDGVDKVVVEGPTGQR